MDEIAVKTNAERIGEERGKIEETEELPVGYKVYPCFRNFWKRTVPNTKKSKNTCNSPKKVVYYKRHKEKGKSESKNLALNSCKIGGKIWQKSKKRLKA